MKKMGISQEEIPAKRVIIEKEGSNIIIDNPSVVKVNMQGQESFQITGEINEEQGITEEDIKQVMKKTSCSKEKAKKALEDANGDLAEAILSLQNS